MDKHIHIAKTVDEEKAALKIRYEVQFKPHGLTMENATNYRPSEKDFTIIYKDDGKICAAANAFILPNNEAELVHLAVMPEYQKQGLGKKMVMAMEEVMQKKGMKAMTICARDYLNKFYSSLGYKPVGEIIKYPDFAKIGIYHQMMRKDL